MRKGLLILAVLAVLVGACSGDANVDTTNGTEDSVPTTSTTAAPTPTSTEPEPVPGPLIGIRSVDGVAEFYDTLSEDRWIPRGTNLIRVYGAGAETPISQNTFDAVWIEERLQAMEDLGFNVVRVMLEICDTGHCVAGPNEEISPQFLDNATQFLAMAASHGIHVMYSSNDLPADSWYTREAFVEGESDFLTDRNVEVYRQYFSDFLTGLIERDAPLDWLWSMELRNEYVYQRDWPPWDWTEGEFTAANGQTYDMAYESDRGRLSSESLTFWADEMTAEIKSIRPELLVSIGLLASHDNINPFGEGDPRWLIVGDFHEQTDVEFFDIHGIRSSVEVAMERYNLSDIDEKPVIIGEFGGTSASFGSIDIAAWVASLWQTVSCQGGFDGWLTWHWMGEPDGTPVRWPVEGTIIGEVLSPKLHPDPCGDVDVEIAQVSWRAPATASATEAEMYAPSNLTDSNPESYWSAGNGVPQWFEIDFGAPATLGTFRLPIGLVTPDGRVVIEVMGSGPGTGGERVLLHTFDEEIAPGDVLEHTLESPVEGIQVVRFNVRRMRDWVIFHDVEVFRAP
jgi:hypothetical protein